MKTVKPENHIKEIIVQTIGVQFRFLDIKTGGAYILLLDGKPMLVEVHRACLGFYPWYKVYHPRYGVWSGNIRKRVGKPARVNDYPDDDFWKKYLEKNEFIDKTGISIKDVTKDTAGMKRFYLGGQYEEQ
jgi:hypothetical protein